ncbi:MAG: haloalkane dehalogenase [Lewinella sp.]|uniref:haloalkane dehalogenase n=1 Tax=Lewinella sp. TaxID=2004506 RepID=UPI003D6BFA13
MDFLRTPDEHFQHLPDWPFQPNYIEWNGMRMHYVDEGEGETILLLHGEPSWSYLYRKMIPGLAKNHRVIAFDWLGFGRSDKPTQISDYTFDFHFQSFHHLLDQLQLKDITLVVQDWGGLLGLPMVGQRPELFKRLVIMNTFIPDGTEPGSKAFNIWRTFALKSPVLPIGRIISQGTHRPLDRAVRKAYDAPFPNAKYKAGARAFPALVPMTPGDPAVPYMKKAREVLGGWQKPCLVAFSDKDPIIGGARGFFADLVPTAEGLPEKRIKNAGHFLQEDAGEEIVEHILAFLGRHVLA